jgi:hypothetical protein
VDDIELDHIRAMADDDTRNNKCGMGCASCGAFYTMTGYGKEWHEPGCLVPENRALRADIADLNEDLKIAEGAFDLAIRSKIKYQDERDRYKKMMEGLEARAVQAEIDRDRWQLLAIGAGT